MSLNPEIINLPADTWVKCADNVTTGYIYITDTKPNTYLQTLRVTGDPAPTDKSDAVKLKEPSEPISATSGIDIYIMAVRVDGQVRVDL